MVTEPDLRTDFGAFYRANLDVVLAFCVRRVGDPELAADLAAEVFAAALVGRNAYRSSLGQPRQWLLGIAAHKIIDAQRRGFVERRAQEQLGIAPIEWSDADLERVASDGRLTSLLTDLPDEQRCAIQARVLEERSYAEIARTEGTSVVTVRKRVSRGLAALRARLSGEEL
jgi:RNA polymerase sigma factor (sigma-70 family)